MSQPFFIVHSTNSNAPLLDREALGDVHVSYFENRFGEYMVAVGSYQTGLVTVYHSDAGFEPKRFDYRFFERGPLRATYLEDMARTEALMELLILAGVELESLLAVRRGAMPVEEAGPLYERALQRLAEHQANSGNIDGLMLDDSELTWLAVFWQVFWPSYQTRLLSVAEAAQIAGVTPQYLYKIIAGKVDSRRLDVVKSGETTLISRHELEQCFPEMRNKQ